MNTNHKYDPEDIESLLMHKQYNELFDDEREFVLQHVKNEEEYNSLRSMLFTLHDQPYQEEWLEPDPSIKKELPYFRRACIGSPLASALNRSASIPARISLP